MTDTITSTLTAPQAAAAAAAAAPAVAAASREERARWLEAVADALDAAKAELVPVAVAESHLPEARLSGEVGRTTGQLRLFAAVLRDGAYLEVIIDHADALGHPAAARSCVDCWCRSGRSPSSPRPTSRSPSRWPVATPPPRWPPAAPSWSRRTPVTPSSPGGPRAVVTAALAEAGAPDGVFGLVEGPEAGRVLVQDPAITAGGFTGSLTGGRALFDLASRRPDADPLLRRAGQHQPGRGHGRLPWPPRCRRWPRVWSVPSPWAPGSSAPSPAWCSCPRVPVSRRWSPRPWAGQLPRPC